MDLRKTLAQLVSIDSVSSRSNAEIVSYLADRCQTLGFQIRRFTYTDDSGIEKINLVAVAGTGSLDVGQVELALVGHTDTVPYDPTWKEATNLTEREGKLYGRGACDTKGFIAATLTAVENLGHDRLRRPLSLIFTADEEIGLVGAKRLADARPLRARYSVVGEPTSLQPIYAGKGYSLAEVLVRGREAHSAYPALGDSAIFRASRLIARIEALAEALKAAQHVAFDPPYTSLNVGLIHGGSAKNVIAGQCRFSLEWRPIPGQDSKKLLKLVDSAIVEEKARDMGFECVVDATRADSGFETPRDSRIVTLLEKLTGKTAGTVAFGTEAAQMTALGAETVVLGPGDIRVAHRTGEFVPVDELQRCVEIIGKTIEALCF